MLLPQLQMSLKTPCEVPRVKQKRLRYRRYADGKYQHADIFLCRSKGSCFFCPQEAEAFALYHKALDLQKHDKFEESAKAYHELLKTPLLKEVRTVQPVV